MRERAIVRPRRCVGYSPEYSCNRPPLRGETLCAFCKGRSFELDVRHTLLDLGAEVTHNVTIDGTQCDLLAIFDERLGKVSYYIECKADVSPVGVNTVNQFYATYITAAQTHHFDKPMLISLNGFTADARAKAESVGVVCYTHAELRRRRADFTPYLTARINEYEDSAFFRKKHYITIQGRLAGIDHSQPLHELIDDFSSDRIQGPLLIVFGDFGAGKTTTLKRVFWSHAKRAMASPDDVRTPIFVSLRDFQMTMDLNRTLLGMLVNDYGMNLHGLGPMHALNKEGRLLFLLDAFDEMIARAGFEFVIPAFQQFEKVVTPRSKAVLTIRTHFLRDADHLASIAEQSELKEYATGRGYPTISVQPLVPEQIADYADKIAPGVLDGIRSDRRLSQLATRPILLDMIVETLPHLSELNRIPNTGDLFRVYTDQWLDRDEWRCKMDHKSRRVFSEKLAYHFCKNGRSTIHYSELSPIIQKEFPEVTKARDLEYFDVDVRTSSFLTRDAGGNYSFANKSFYEYFLASKLMDDARAGENVDLETLYPAETLDFMEDIVKVEIAGGSAASIQTMLSALFWIACENAPEIKSLHDRKAWEPVAPDADARAYEACGRILHRLSAWVEEWGTAAHSVVVFDYRARHFRGNVEVAGSWAGWRRHHMRTFHGSADEFLYLAILPNGHYEYKYLEPGGWEPGDNRSLRVDGERRLLWLKEASRM